jgi:hypothetical protein
MLLLLFPVFPVITNSYRIVIITSKVDVPVSPASTIKTVSWLALTFWPPPLPKQQQQQLGSFTTVLYICFVTLRAYEIVIWELECNEIQNIALAWQQRRS